MADVVHCRRMGVRDSGGIQLVRRRIDAGVNGGAMMIPLPLRFVVFE